MDAREAIRFTLGSSARLAILRATFEPTTLAGLTTALSCSKETIRDTIEWYEEHGWIKNEAGQYVQTAIGAAILSPLAEEEYRGEQTLHRVSSNEERSQSGEYKRETDREDLKSILNSQPRERMLRSESLPRRSRLAPRYETTSTTALRALRLLKFKGMVREARNDS